MGREETCQRPVGPDDSVTDQYSLALGRCPKFTPAVTPPCLPAGSLPVLLESWRIFQSWGSRVRLEAARTPHCTCGPVTGVEGEGAASKQILGDSSSLSWSSKEHSVSEEGCKDLAREVNSWAPPFRYGIRNSRLGPICVLITSLDDSGTEEVDHQSHPSLYLARCGTE